MVGAGTPPKKRDVGNQVGLVAEEVPRSLGMGGDWIGYSGLET